MRKKLARAGLIGALAVATLAYGALDKTITLRIEGRAASVHTFALTVRDVLARDGIRLGPQDWVSPPLGARLREGTAVDVRRAKEIEILLNGRPKLVVTTALTVDELLTDLRLRDTIADYVSASRSSRLGDGMLLVYREAVGIRVQHDGATDQVITNAPTVGTVLSELGVDVGARDIVVPAPAAYPAAGTTIVVKRVGDRVEKVDVPIDYPTVYRRTLNMEYGTTSTVQSGSDGVRLVSYLSTYVDGVRVKRRPLASQVVRMPRPRIVAIGAGFPGCLCKAGSEGGQASWYNASGLTAAHPWLPFGTVVRVENVATGAWVNVVIRDRGPYAGGRIIDLSNAAFSRIAPLSQGVVQVLIRW